MGKLGIYLLANYPSRRIFLEAVRACRDAGVDFLEIGFAFSDPVADGPLLERASFEVLKRCRLNDLVGAFHEARALFTRRIYIMTYTNIAYSNGITRFIRSVKPLSGLILADLPLRELSRVERMMRTDSINLVRFLTPESREDDIALTLKGARDFIYFISKRGTTGGAFALSPATMEKIGRMRGKGVDVYVGFGIRDRKDFCYACSVADGAIIGTQALAELEQGLESFKRFLGSLRS